MVRVAVDDQIFSMQTRGGVSRYFVELIREFSANPVLGVQLVTSRYWTKNEHMIELGLGRPLPTRLNQSGKVIRFANRRTLHSKSKDIVHHTYYRREYLRHFRESSLRVVTIYDMIPELAPDLFPKGNPHLYKHRFIDEADLILCISESTRNDLLEIYGTPIAPIEVTPLGVNPAFRPNCCSPDFLPERYILFVGSRGGYKDFSVLVEAFGSAGFPPDIRLVAVGGGHFTQAELALLTRVGVLDRVFQVAANDGELACAYAHAECFVFPSRYEGFGLPTLEAMAAGCPTILASTPTHREVGGNAAIYFPVGDVFELAKVLGDVVNDQDLRSARRELGFVNSARFTWRETARLTAAAYRNHLPSPDLS